MTTDIEKRIARSIQLLRDGTLTESDLRSIGDSIDGLGRGRQDLLYLQARTSALDSPVLGMAIVRDGGVDEGPSDPNEWPYKSVIDALQDGWRIIKFPELALSVDERRTYGLGSEFILERWDDGR